MELIARQTLSGAAASVTFSDIAATWRDLRLIWVGTHASTAAASMSLRLNGDTGTNYSDTLLNGNGSAAASSRRSSVAYLYVGELAGTTLAYPTPITVDIMAYANTNVFTTVLSASAVAGTIVTRGVGLWRSTAAVTSLSCQIYGGGTNQAAGSTFSLYGIGSV
jgi:hypothetical protein